MPELAIYYATMTGNAEELARDAERRARLAGWTPQLANLSEASPLSIATAMPTLFIVSTWGDGEPPADAEEFYDELSESEADLSALRYAILGLGDSSYPDFNAFSRALDERLGQLGAQPLRPRIEADFDFEDTYRVWIEEALETLQKRLQEPAPR